MADICVEDSKDEVEAELMSEWCRKESEKELFPYCQVLKKCCPSNINPSRLKICIGPCRVAEWAIQTL